MTDALTIPRVRPPDKTPLHVESQVRVLRSSLLAPLFLAQDLRLHGFEHRLSTMIVEVDRLLEELDLAS